MNCHLLSKRKQLREQFHPLSDACKYTHSLNSSGQSFMPSLMLLKTLTQNLNCKTENWVGPSCILQEE